MVAATKLVLFRHGPFSSSREIKDPDGNTIYYAHSPFSAFHAQLFLRHGSKEGTKVADMRSKGMLDDVSWNFVSGDKLVLPADPHPYDAVTHPFTFQNKRYHWEKDICS